jgi:hypothetical protein
MGHIECAVSHGECRLPEISGISRSEKPLADEARGHKVDHRIPGTIPAPAKHGRFPGKPPSSPFSQPLSITKAMADKSWTQLFAK